MFPLLVTSWFVSAALTLEGANKTSTFDVAADKKFESDVLTSIPDASKIFCAKECLDSVNCTACNWHEPTRTCDLLRATALPVAAPGYTALTRKGISLYSCVQMK